MSVPPIATLPDARRSSTIASTEAHPKRIDNPCPDVHLSPAYTHNDDGGDEDEVLKQGSPTVEDIKIDQQAAEEQAETAPIIWPNEDPVALKEARATREALIEPIREQIEAKKKKDSSFLRLIQEKEAAFKMQKGKKPKKESSRSKGPYDGFEDDIVPDHPKLRYNYDQKEYLLRRLEDEANILFSNTSTTGILTEWA